MTTTGSFRNKPRIHQPKQRETKPIEVQALTLDQAALAIGCARNYLYKLIRSGELPARKLGGKTLLLPSEIQQFLESLPRLEPSRRPVAAAADASAAEMDADEASTSPKRTMPALLD